MKTTLNSRAPLDARTPGCKAAARPTCQPPPPPTQSVAEDQQSQVTPAPHKLIRSTPVLAAVLVLLAGILAAMRISSYQSPAMASCKTHLAELDNKLSRALAGQLHAAGYEFEAVIVSVEGPACRRAVCLLKGLRRNDGVAFTGQVAARHAGNGTWSFAGAGMLAAVRFDVYAAAEIQRVAESTPPDFQQAALTAITPSQPEPEPVVPFNQEFDVWLPAAGQEPPLHWLDLETAQCLAEPDRDYFINARAYSRWCRTNGLDLYALVLPDRGYSTCTRGMVLIPVQGKQRAKSTADEILSHPGLRSALRRVRSTISTARSQTDTYLFRTEQGTCGILKLLEIDESTQQLRIRYRLAGPLGQG